MNFEQNSTFHFSFPPLHHSQIYNKEITLSNIEDVSSFARNILLNILQEFKDTEPDNTYCVNDMDG